MHHQELKLFLKPSEMSAILVRVMRNYVILLLRMAQRSTRQFPRDNGKSEQQYK